MSLRVACPITMALPRRGAVEPIVILRKVKAALATFVDPGVGGGARNLAWQGKGHRENDNPFHVWPACFASYGIQETARPTASSICFRHFPITAIYSRVHLPEIMLEMGKAETGAAARCGCQFRTLRANAPQRHS